MIKELPSISIITPSFNQGQYIRQTVESILSQHYSKLEYIVIDGLSTDNSLSILGEYSDNLTLIAEKDSGQTDAINKGLRMATGDIVCWLNSDDYFLPGTLNYVGEFFATHPNHLWLSGDCQIVDQTGQRIQEPIRHYKRLLRHLSPAFYLSLTNAICQPATFWRRSIHDDLGFLDESLRYTMDYDWWLRLNKLQSPTIANELFTAFRIHKQSKGGSQFEQQFAEDFETLCRYQTNSLVKAGHQAHNQLIKAIYRLIKG
jgi:glycosyltransferase involved in cell wall biosynthesis